MNVKGLTVDKNVLISGLYTINTEKYSYIVYSDDINNSIEECIFKLENGIHEYNVQSDYFYNMINDICIIEIDCRIERLYSYLNEFKGILYETEENKYKIDNPNSKYKFPCVYEITSHDNSIYYIGSTANLYNRSREHKSKLNNNKHHNRALQNEYNLNNTMYIRPIKVLNHRLTKRQRVDIEGYYIDKYKKKYGDKVLNIYY